jgi:hypothetical protein
VAWTVIDHPDFDVERERLPRNVLDKLAEVILALEERGPQLGRPLVDTLKGSEHPNMKEIRIAVNGAWRFAFAFDPERNAIILVGGNKEGVSSDRFYKNLIKIADERFDEWLKAVE